MVKALGCWVGLINCLRCFVLSYGRRRGSGFGVHALACLDPDTLNSLSRKYAGRAPLCGAVFPVFFPGGTGGLSASVCVYWQASCRWHPDGPAGAGPYHPRLSRQSVKRELQTDRIPSTLKLFSAYVNCPAPLLRVGRERLWNRRQGVVQANGVLRWDRRGPGHS